MCIRDSPDPVHKDEVDNLRRTIDDLFDQGRAACARKEWLSERDYNLLSVVSQRATFLYGHRQILLDGDIGQRVEALSGEAWNLLAAGTDGSAARGGWYEIEGDRRSADEEAELVYGQGVQWSPGWRSLWFKHIGCLSRLGKSEAINGALATLTPELIEAILKSGIGGLRREIASIREQIEYPLKFPGIFDRLGIMPPKGVILYGPAEMCIRDSFGSFAPSS